VRHWTTFTPDGLRLVVTRHKDGWSVLCGESTRVRHELLDVALIQAMRNEADVGGHSMRTDYAAWARKLADWFESEDRGRDTVGTRRAEEPQSS
jgi:hypothetical protein